MERGKVKKILMFYRDIDGELKYNAKIIRDYEDEYYTAGGGSALDGVPKSKHKISRPAEVAALNTPAFVSMRIRELETANEQLGKLKGAIMQELDKLPLVQKNILYDFYIKGMQWVQIAFAVNYSERQCRNICYRGLDNLAEYFSRNALVRSFNYPF